MDIDATFLPVAKELIDQVFPTAVTYHQHVDGTGGYDPATGTITDSEIDHNIKAGVLSRSVMAPIAKVVNLALMKTMNLRSGCITVLVVCSSCPRPATASPMTARSGTW